MKVFLVTGASGFIGYHLSRYLLGRGDMVIGLDNNNDYYDQKLKYSRLKLLGIQKEKIVYNKIVYSSVYENFAFVEINIEDNNSVESFFKRFDFDCVCNLAAQAGVRYSLKKPHAYINSNVNGFINILEGCRNNQINHLVYASSSSVYGLNVKVPFSENDSIAHPVSLYAATKKSNELMAHAYSHLYNIPTTGLRFFTVYGPWGRPDMSPFLFADAILRNRPIKIFNNGDMLRDFTYIDDIVEAIVRVLDNPAKPDGKWNGDNPNPGSSSAPYKIYNVGNSSSVRLMDFIEAIEEALGYKAQKEYLPMQPGDVYQTYADTSCLERDFNFKPLTSINEGVKKTVEWFREYYKL